jgi:sirohydrochlorin ferrochelatase
MATLDQVADLLPDHPVDGCFLEAAAPDILTVLEAMAADGLERVVAVPLLLFAAGHARHDIPQALEHAAARTGLQVRQADVLGWHPEVLQLSARRFGGAAGQDYDPDSTCWLFVGRGSNDDHATAAFHEFTRRRRELTPVAHLETAFLALAQPRVEEVAKRIASSSCERVVVQPHLLYPGSLLSRLRQIVAEQELSGSRQQWILADCLGCDRAIARAVVDRYQAALRDGGRRIGPG